MNTVTLTALSLLVCAAALLIKKEHPVFSFAIIAAGCTAIILNVLSLLPQISEAASSLCTKTGINSEWLAILVKSLGICCITRFGCDCCRDAGYTSIGSAVEFSGKAAVILLSLPIIKSIADAILSLVN